MSRAPFNSPPAVGAGVNNITGSVNVNQTGNGEAITATSAQGSRAIKAQTPSGSTSIPCTIAIWNDLQSTSDALEFAYNGSAGSAMITGGPSGESGAIYTRGSFPLSLGTNLTEHIRIPATAGSTTASQTLVYEPLYLIQANRAIGTVNTGSFTGTTTGLVSNLGSLTFKWSRSGGIVFLWFTANTAISGTSNASTFTITGAPQEIATSTPQGQYSAVNSGAVDNGVNGGWVMAMAGTVLKFFFVSAFGNTQIGWTSSGTKSLPQLQWGFAYSID